MKHRHEHAFWNYYSQINPKRKISHLMHIYGEPAISEVWSFDVHQDSVNCVPYRLLYPGQPAAWGSPLSAITVTSTKLLILFYSPTESLRPVTSSSAWNQDQQHKDDFPASWLTGYFSLHIHTLFPVSCLLVTGHVLSGGIWFLKA